MVAHHWQDLPSSEESSLSPLLLVQPELSLHTPESSTLASGVPAASLPAAATGQPTPPDLGNPPPPPALSSTDRASQQAVLSQSSQRSNTPLSSQKKKPKSPVTVAEAEPSSAGSGSGSTPERVSSQTKTMEASEGNIDQASLLSSQGEFHLRLTPSQGHSLSAVDSHSTESQFRLHLTQGDSATEASMLHESAMGFVPISTQASEATTCSGRPSGVVTIQGRVVTMSDSTPTHTPPSVSVTGKQSQPKESSVEQTTASVSQHRPAAASRLLDDMSEYSGEFLVLEDFDHGHCKNLISFSSFSCHLQAPG